MAFHFNDNINTKSFTPREYQIELLDAAKDRNVIVCLATGPGKIFIATKLIQDLSNSVRKPFDSGGLRTLYLVDTPSSVALQASYIRHLTDLSVGEYSSTENVESWTFAEWKEELQNHQVLVMRSDICLNLLQNKFLTVANLNLMVLDECHRAIKAHPLRQIMKEYYATSTEQPRVLGLTAPMLNGNCDPARLEAEILRLESALYSTAETASDIVSILRYCNKPKELVLECALPQGDSLAEILKQEVATVQEFLTDHRYDPSEVYDDEFLEELQGIPDPKIDPERLLEEFLNVLNTLGSYCADKAAFVILIQIERLKVKTPYERHFLLLCMVSSVLVKIRAICDDTFRQYDEKERIYLFSSPKILRLLEVLKQFKPEKSPEEKHNCSAIENEVTTNEGNPTSDSSKDVSLPSSNIGTEKEVRLSIENKTDNKSEENFDNMNNTNNLEIDYRPKRDNVDVDNNEIPLLDNEHVEGNGVEVISNDVDITPKSKNENLPLTIEELTVGSQQTKANGCFVCDTSVLEKSPEQIQNISTSKELCCDLELANKTTNGIIHPKVLARDVVRFNETKTNGRLDFIPRSRFAKYRRGLFYKEEPGSGTRTGKPELNHRLHRNLPSEDVDALCALVLVRERFTAKILFHLLSEIRKNDEDFAFLVPQYTVEKVADPEVEGREAEAEHRKQEEVLKRFRMRECNLLIGTSVLEEGIDMPKCNLVVRFDVPLAYRSYVQSKGRARAQDAHYILMVDQTKTAEFVRELAQYIEIEQLLLRKCDNREPSEKEELEADQYTDMVCPYQPVDSPTNASVTMATAVALVNRYCAKLPSDTFTRLTPLCTMKVIRHHSRPAYVCTVRLPINSPMKQDIVGLPMPTRVLARRIAAMKTCCVLHQARELDANLLPVGKESFRLHEEEETTLALEEIEEMVPRDSNEPRPGTTKRRQYYYKRIAQSLTECRPVPGKPARLYFISMVLTCPLPEEQNTRGRKIYPPEESPQGFGILTLRTIPKICAFPIFTRSGEVRVKLELSDSRVFLTEDKVEKIVTFLNYTFTSVLRLQKYLMMFDPQASENSYFVVPTRKPKGRPAEVDWEFLERIYEDRDLRPYPVPEEERKTFAFDAPKYHDAVIMPWYRNQDQPQYFYVAEICGNLNPKSAFPGSEYKTFDEYYTKKYDIRIQNGKQPLLDVDHTSARLNFLTPRYVNRKGVALPTSSEETKRAKRENLEQKQILVPELCTVHPFPASLWRKAVCLPCVLYRINALLLADQIRRQVAEDIALGREKLGEDFEWRPLDFGWCLADVLQKSKENAKKEAADKRELKESVEEEIVPEKEEEDKLREDWMEIGTWSNEMAVDPSPDPFDLPPNVTMVGEGTCGGGGGSDWGTGVRARYGSPSSRAGGALERDLEGFETEDDSSDSDSYDRSDDDDGLRIQFKGHNEAEAVEDERGRRSIALDSPAEEEEPWEFDADVDERCAEAFREATADNETVVRSCGMLVPFDRPVEIARRPKRSAEVVATLNLANVAPHKTVDGITFNCDTLPLPPAAELCDSGFEVDSDSDPDSDPDSGLLDEDRSVGFSFDVQPDLTDHPGPSPSLVLQALTMSNANDGINLERLETIGDSFLKYAITTYLYCTYENIHEGKLSHLRSKQVSNLNLYRLGRRKVFGESMIATKFEPHDNWLPPCYYVPRELEQALIEAGVPASHWNQADLPALRDLSREEICRLVRERSERLKICDPDGPESVPTPGLNVENLPCFIPYNLITQHSIPDKSLADCVEALIGAYLIACGPRGALIFMAWLGICVLPKEERAVDNSDRPVGSVLVDSDTMICYGQLRPPRSPLLRNVPRPEAELRRLLDGYEVFERRIGYRFADRSYLLQALTHASYSPNRLTDCYQRLEFLGDAVLDYLITRHLYEDSRQHSPGALTDLRSALVNNTIFASLAVRYGFHKYFRHLSPGLNDVVDRFVRIQEENGHTISEEYYLIGEEECEEAEDVEVPKALGDVFESVAGAIFLDSKMSLDAVWKVYYRMMKLEIEQFSTNVPKSPIRDLLELEPETAKFGKPEKLADGRRVRVTVEVFGKGTFKGIGRNYRIAKCTAAKCALKQLKKRGLLAKKQ